MTLTATTHTATLENVTNAYGDTEEVPVSQSATVAIGDQVTATDHAFYPFTVQAVTPTDLGALASGRSSRGVLSMAFFPKAV